MFAALAQGLGSLVGAGASLWGADEDRKMQEKFAKNGIQWKVADAEKAGVHPLFALGASTSQYSPVGVGDAGTHLAQTGQDVGRAIDATSPKSQRLDAYTQAVQKLTLDKMGLENQLLASKIATINQPGSPANAPGGIVQPYFEPGQPDFPGIVKTAPFSRQAAAIGNAWQEPAATTDVGFARTSSGGYAAVPSKDVKEKIEDDLISELQWSIRNRLLPTFGYGKSEPFPPKEGYAWVYNPLSGEYTQRKIAPGGLFTW